MVDCLVCRYWSERIQESRTDGRDQGAIDREKDLMAVLRTHQSGAFVSRFPRLLRDPVVQELVSADQVPAFCDPLRPRTLTDDKWFRTENKGTGIRSGYRTVSG
jgi:hypothetical protein